MTLKEIAKEAGVSISTVSRVINGNSPNAARQDVQNRIWEIAKKHNYIPNSSAQKLKKQNLNYSRTHSIACIYARTQDTKNDTFFTSLARSIEKEALKLDYVVKHSFTALDIQNPIIQEQLINQDIDGIVILGRCDKAALEFMKKNFRKVIYTGLNPLDTDYDQVICDGYAIANDAMEYLLSLGHTKIAYIGETHNEIRYNAYCDVLHKRNIKLNKMIAQCVSGASDSGYHGALQLLTNHPEITAIFCMNDLTALGVYKAIKELQYQIPRDISIISIDDVDLAQYMSPMLTTMHIPIDEMGKITIKVLIDRIQNGHKLPLRITLPYSLTQRESCLSLPYSKRSFDFNQN